MAKQGKYVYEWPRAMVTVDAVVFRPAAGKTEVLLINRKREPYKGKWAVPGGFIEMDEGQDKIRAGDDAAKAQWFDIENLPEEMAFDHDEMVKCGIEKLAERWGKPHPAGP